MSDINWIVDRARKRGLENPDTFMSSKPKSGFNHKQYGVTSEGKGAFQVQVEKKKYIQWIQYSCFISFHEGVNVYLDVALRRVLGIDPKRDAFTVKITGKTQSIDSLYHSVLTQLLKRIHFPINPS